MAGSLAFTAYAGPCWRAVAASREASVLAGSERAGRYNRPGERALCMSGSPEGVAAAMARYGDAARAVVRLTVHADELLDLREPATRAVLGCEPEADWMAALDRGEVPRSWRVADAARAVGAAGLVEASRRAPAEWHLIVFRWNEAGGAVVAVTRD